MQESLSMFFFTLRLKRKGATPPNRAERVVRDLQTGMMAAPMVNLETKHRRNLNSSSSSQEHIANLMSSPNLQSRLNKVCFHNLVFLELNLP